MVGNVQKAHLKGATAREEKPWTDSKALQRHPLWRILPSREQLPILEGQRGHLGFVAGVRPDRPDDFLPVTKGKVRDVAGSLPPFECRKQLDEWPLHLIRSQHVQFGNLLDHVWSNDAMRPSEQSHDFRIPLLTVRDDLLGVGQLLRNCRDRERVRTVPLNRLVESRQPELAKL